METAEIKQEPLTFEKVWAMFQETRKILDEKFQETDRQMKETDLKIQDTFLQMKDTDIRMKETDVRMKETDVRMKETDRMMKNLLTKMSDSELRWGKFVESLVEGAVLKLLAERGIKVSNTSMREKAMYNDRRYEIDIIARNGEDVVAIEVKTTLRPSDVKEFISELKVFKEAYHFYSGKKIYGAVAYISLSGSADIMAEKAGLFVFKATGESARITNAPDFKPKVW